MRPMRFWSWVWIGLVTIGCGGPRVSAPVGPLRGDLAAFGRLPDIEDVAISPDGSQIAFVQTIDGDQRVVVVLKLADRSVVGRLRAGSAKIRDIMWGDDTHIVVTTSATGIPFGMLATPDEWLMLQSYDVAQHRIEPLLEGNGTETTVNVTFGPRMMRRVNGGTILYVTGLWAPRRHLMPALFRINLDGGREEIARKGTPMSRGWLVDDAGEVVAENAYDTEASAWVL